MKKIQKMAAKRALRAAAFVTSLTAALIASSCGGTSSNSGTDSNTHWLDQCTKDADCGSLSCRCGVCTRECSAGPECADLGASATCGALPGCSTTGTSCVRSVAKDAGPADCPSPAITPGTSCEPVDHPCWSTCTQGYREELTCTGGKWAAGHGLFPCADGGVGGADAGLCAAFQRIQDYNGYVDAGTVVSILGPTRAATCETRLSDYDVTCMADTDCVNVPLGNACVTPCDLLCDVAAINRRDLAKLQADNAATPIGFERGVCGTFCGCPQVFDPRCVSGRCTQPFSQSDGG